MRIGCIADVHLGAGVSAYGPERLDDQEQVLAAAFRTFVERDCKLVVIAGDTWDGPLVPPEQYVAFARCLPILDALLDEIPVVMINGNGRHDLATREVNALRVFEAAYPVDKLHIACEPTLVRAGEVVVGCLPWTPVSQYVAKRNGASRDAIHAEVSELLLTIAKDLRERGADILVGHWALTGAALPSGLPVELANEPILDVDALAEIGFDQLVFGHIHKPQPLADGAGFYCGSPLPLTHGEAGVDHGVWILDPDDGPEFVPLPSRRFVTITDDDGMDVDVADAIVRVKYQVTEAEAANKNPAATRDWLLNAGAWRVSVEPTVVRETQARIAVSDDTDDLEAFDQWCAAEEIDEGLIPALQKRHKEHVEAVPE